MTLTDHYQIWWRQHNDKVICGRRATTSWKQFTGLHKLSPKQFTTEAVGKEIARLLKTYSASTVRRSLADLSVFAKWLLDVEAMRIALEVS